MVDEFGFPYLLFTSGDETMPFIGLQAIDDQLPCPTIVKLLGMPPELAAQTAHGAGVDADQACGALERTTLPKCSATAMACASGTLQFHSAVPLRSLNSFWQTRHRR